MNTRIDLLQPYPFQRMAALLDGVTPNQDYSPIALSIGEPKHAAPEFIVEALSNQQRLRSGLGTYPATKGSDELREAFSRWSEQRFAAPLAAQSQVLPVSGTREALFSFAQAVLPQGRDTLVGMPNPGYQIYEGAALLAGATPLYLPCTSANNYGVDYTAISEEQWQNLSLIYLCSPGNPTGQVTSRSDLKTLIELAAKHNVILASDECYSEIYFSENEPPAGLLQVAREMGLDDYAGLMVFHSLSKRSNLPGLRSGCVAGDARLIERFLTYRTYHGAAMAAHVQQVSALAWDDETHVQANRRLYRDKFASAVPRLAPYCPVRAPSASFYLWLPTPESDEAFTRRVYADYNLKLLPGSFLGRAAHAGSPGATLAGTNPGAGYVRIALVASQDECDEAIGRLELALA
ncbi:MAG: succinyldiaminopimelate transaminase [Pseudomonadaceae bacterium]|nr:succinyldiaminopimelate transaminase [Pseudomonadaceae bacterium]